MSATLPPTRRDLEDPRARPYFLWWSNLTVADFRLRLASADAEERAYWMAALLREANSRDVWLFVEPREIREAWPLLLRYLGRARPMWAWLLGLDAPQWPPPEARGGQECVALTEQELASYRDDLAERFKRRSLPGGAI